MRHRRLVRILVAFVVAAITAGVMATPAAAGGPPRYQLPDLVAIGDSFAAGTGNVPYQPDDGECDRSASAASSELLAAICGALAVEVADVVAQASVSMRPIPTMVIPAPALAAA